MTFPINRNEIALLYGPLLYGLAVLVLTHFLLSVINRDRPLEAQEWEFEKRRLMRLREQSRCFRWFEPLIDELGRACQTRIGIKVLCFLQVHRWTIESLERLGPTAPYQWYEYVALSLFQGLVVGVLCAMWMFVTSAQQWLWVAPLMVGFMFLTQINKLKSCAKSRMSAFKKRLPFSVDLMALTMDAGATFMETLESFVDEINNRDNPAAEELAQLHRKVISGRPMSAGLEELQKRMRDDTVDEVVFSLINSERLGTPISVTLLRLADQMRSRRSQAIEKTIGEAQTMMAFPGFVIMVACLLIVVAPFGIAALQKQW